jgi:uncharacterized protein with GYD domain
MHFVLLAEHTADVCPTSNSSIRELMQKVGPQVPSIAEKHGVTIVAGPFVNREHVIVAVVESDDPAAVDSFIMESTLGQWNTVRVLPSHTIQEGMAQLEDQPAIF